VSVLRDGELVATRDTAATTEAELVRLMVGRAVDRDHPASTSRAGGVVLEARGLRSAKVREVSLQVRAGEILGLAGLVGAGRTETARLLFGADPREAGEILVDGRPVAIGSPGDAIAAGIGLIPEDRKRHGALLNQSVTFNAVFAALRRVSPGLLADARAERAAAARLRDQLQIKTPSLDQLVGRLSGGNQQKVVLAKWLLTESRVLIFDEPTRGIDVGAKQEIYALMRRLSDRGAAIIMISSEMPELLGMSDHILVLAEGTGHRRTVQGSIRPGAGAAPRLGSRDDGGGGMTSEVTGTAVTDPGASSGAGRRGGLLPRLAQYGIYLAC
jgi:ribose transport system ATP-binding protein